MMLTSQDITSSRPKIIRFCSNFSYYHYYHQYFSTNAVIANFQFSSSLQAMKCTTDLSCDTLDTHIWTCTTTWDCCTFTTTESRFTSYYLASTNTPRLLLHPLVCYLLSSSFSFRGAVMPATRENEKKVDTHKRNSCSLFSVFFRALPHYS